MSRSESQKTRRKPLPPAPGVELGVGVAAEPINWNGLTINPKNRTPAGSVALCPPLPVKFCREPVSIAGWAGESATLMAALESALAVATGLKGSKKRGRTQIQVEEENLDVTDLRLPGPVDIMAATTIEVADNLPAQLAQDAGKAPAAVTTEQLGVTTAISDMQRPIDSPGQGREAAVAVDNGSQPGTSAAEPAQVQPSAHTPGEGKPQSSVQDRIGLAGEAAAGGVPGSVELSGGLQRPGSDRAAPDSLEPQQPIPHTSEPGVPREIQALLAAGNAQQQGAVQPDGSGVEPTSVTQQIPTLPPGAAPVTEQLAWDRSQRVTLAQGAAAPPQPVVAVAHSEPPAPVALHPTDVQAVFPTHTTTTSDAPISTPAAATTGTTAAAGAVPQVAADVQDAAGGRPRRSRRAPQWMHDTFLTDDAAANAHAVPGDGSANGPSSMAAGPQGPAQGPQQPAHKGPGGDEPARKRRSLRSASPAAAAAAADVSVGDGGGEGDGAAAAGGGGSSATALQRRKQRRADPGEGARGAQPAAPPPLQGALSLRRKEPGELTQAEWRQVYSRHAWVFDQLGVYPPGVKPSIPGAHTAPRKEAAPASGGAGPSRKLARATTAVTGATLRLNMVEEWKKRLEAARPNLATMQDLSTALDQARKTDSRRAAPQPGSKSTPLDAWLLQMAALYFNRESKARAAAYEAETRAQAQAGLPAPPPPALPLPASPITGPAAVGGKRGGKKAPLPPRAPRRGAIRSVATAAQPGAESSSVVGSDMPQPAPPHAGPGPTGATGAMGAAPAVVEQPTAGATQVQLSAAPPPTEVDWQSEVLVDVCVFTPRRNDQMCDEFLMLGSQPLTALPDHLHCVAALNLGSVNKAGSGSSYLFVEGTFYNDLRPTGAVDLSAPIIALCHDKGMIPSHVDARAGMRMVYQPAAVTGADDTDVQRVCGTADMKDVTFGQLRARLSNHPTYVYCHLGCCEHVVQFRDVRRMHAADVRRRDAYPLHLLSNRVASVTRSARRCDVCDSNPAEFVAYDDPLGPANPAFYCSRCKQSLHPRSMPPGASMFPYSGGAAVHHDGPEAPPGAGDGAGTIAGGT